MATNAPKNSVWSAMSYVPPRGRCNYKTSLMSPACPCLRFMLHPVKAATSFECDGCQHHASFHSLENPAEDAILKKWEEVDAEAGRQQQAVAGAKKRKRIAEKPDVVTREIYEIVEAEDGEETEEKIRQHLMANGVEESEFGAPTKAKRTRGKKG